MWKYRKPEPSHVQGPCVKCGTRKQKHKGGGKFKPLCAKCHNERFNIKQKRSKPVYTKFKKGACEFCGFIPVHPCQLDVDHIDGNHFNNDPDNLQTLCANCHRLKTLLNKDWQTTEGV